MPKKPIKTRMPKTIKVGPLGLQAIDDIKPKAERLIKQRLGFNKKITDMDCIEIMGYKQMKNVYGKVHADELVNILKINKKRKEVKRRKEMW